MADYFDPTYFGPEFVEGVGGGADPGWTLKWETAVNINMPSEYEFPITSGKYNNGRYEVPLSSLIGTKIRVSYPAHPTRVMTVAGCSIGPRSGSTMDFSAGPTRITFDTGNSGYTTTPGTTKVSDSVTFAYAGTTPYLHHLTAGLGGYYSQKYVTLSGNDLYYLSNADNDQCMIADVTGYSSGANEIGDFNKVETARDVYAYQEVPVPEPTVVLFDSVPGLVAISYDDLWNGATNRYWYDSENTILYIRDTSGAVNIELEFESGLYEPDTYSPPTYSYQLGGYIPEGSIYVDYSGSLLINNSIATFNLLRYANFSGKSEARLPISSIAQLKLYHNTFGTLSISSSVIGNNISRYPSFNGSSLIQTSILSCELGEITIHFLSGSLIINTITEEFLIGIDIYKNISSSLSIASVVNNAILLCKENLSVNECFHGLHSHNTAIMKNPLNDIRNSYHLQEVESVGLSQLHNILPDDTFHIIYSDITELVINMISIYDSYHELISDNLNVDSNYIIQTNDSYQNIISDDIITLYIKNILCDNSYNDIYSDNIQLTQLHNLAISDCYNDIYSDNIINLVNVLVVSDGIHNVISDKTYLKMLSSPYYVCTILTTGRSNRVAQIV
jgi:hypothetical protein